MEIPNINWMDEITDARAYAKPRKTPRYKTNRKHLQAELRVIEKLHHNDLIVGYADTFNIPEDQLSIEYLVEWRGRYGWHESVLILHNDSPSSQMTVKRAYDYIRLGSSIIASRNLMKYLPWD